MIIFKLHKLHKEPFLLLHFTDEELEGQKVSVIGLKSHTVWQSELVP